MSTIIESEKKVIKASVEEVFNYLSDFNNIKDLLPQDKISDWTADMNACSFKIQNMATIPLVKERVEAPNKIFIISGEKAPFTFTLVVHINQKENLSEGYLVFDGDINPFLKMMVMNPLTNLFNYMAHKLQEHFD